MLAYRHNAKSAFRPPQQEPAGYLTADQLRNRLKEAVDEAGGVAEFANIAGCSYQLVYYALTRDVSVGPSIAKVLGLERITVYRSIKSGT